MLCGDLRGFGEADTFVNAVEGGLTGLISPKTAAQIYAQQNTPITVQGPPPDYTPVMIGGAAMVLLALLVKRNQEASE